MVDERDHAYQGAGEKSAPSDKLNEKIGVLTRREVEARILIPIIVELGESFGHDNVLAVVRRTIVKIAREQGNDLAKLGAGNSLKHFSETLQFWTRDDALEMDIIEESDDVLSFNVTRCRYAELYDSLGIRDIGTIFSCARDYALIEGFNPDVTLTRTQTIMEGAPYCDFRYRLKK